jgi:hypothetical protein
MAVILDYTTEMDYISIKIDLMAVKLDYTTEMDYRFVKNTTYGCKICLNF